MIKVKIIENKIIPFGNFVAFTFLKFIFTKDASKLNDRIIRHEKIHYCQQAELAVIGFIIMYLLSFITQFFRCLFIKNIGRVENDSNSVWMRAYRTVVFEREAYLYENDEKYLENRAPYAWFILNFYV